jgi:hypothetical protein
VPVGARSLVALPFSVFNSILPILNANANPPSGASAPVSSSFSVFNGIAPLSNFSANPPSGESSALGMFSVQNGQASQSSEFRASAGSGLALGSMTVPRPCPNSEPGKTLAPAAPAQLTVQNDWPICTSALQNLNSTNPR